MSAHTLTIQYQAAEIDRLTDPYWIRLEPVGQEPETATVSDAANLLDALYQIDPCTESEDQGQLVEQEDYAPTVAATIDLSYCDQAWDGSVEMDIRVIRSHLAEPYRLQLQGGELVQTLQVSEQVTRTLEISGPTTLDYPVVSGFACSPEPLRRVGNTLLFAEELNGQTLRATYRTRYDLATIKVLGVEGHPGECRALAFHHGLVADETLTPPEAEQVDRSLCPSTSYESPGSEDEVTCYQEVVVHRVCSCSLHEAETLRYEEIVPCPGEMHCANNETRCMHLVGTVSVTEYVRCGDEDRSGDFDGNLSDREFYFDKCCEWPTGPLPTCVTRHRTYRGGKALIHGPEHYRGLYGALTRIVPLSPPGGICGEWTIEQRLISNDCCDYVEPIVVDRDLSISVLGPRDWGYFSFAGGRFPVRVVLHGTGFDLDGMGLKAALIDRQSFRIYAQEFACGVCEVRLSDGCTTATGLVRSTIGQWVERPGDTVVDHAEGLVLQPLDPESTYEGTCQGALPYTWCHTYSSPHCVGIGESPKWRVEEHRFHKYWGTVGEFPACAGAQCAGETYYGHLMQVPGWSGPAWCWPKGGYYECDYIHYRDVWEWIC